MSSSPNTIGDSFIKQRINYLIVLAHIFYDLISIIPQSRLLMIDIVNLIESLTSLMDYHFQFKSCKSQHFEKNNSVWRFENFYDEVDARPRMRK